MIRPELPWPRAVCLATALALGAPAPLLAHTADPNPSNLPTLGDAAGGDMDINAERRLGERIMQELRRDPDYLEDALLLSYVDGVWQPLLAAARASDHISPQVDSLYAWEDFLVRDRGVNAFALPGGYIGVYLGLIALTANRDELAAVLAHETTHVTQRHIARGLASASRQSAATIAAMVLGLIAASRSDNPAAAQAIVLGGQAAIAQGQINFTREMEREADRIGFDLLAGAGYSSAGMAGFFEKMQATTRLNDDGQFPYLRTHPLTVERISEARLRERSATPASAAQEPLLHTLMAARARVLMDPSEAALRRQQAAAAGANAPPLVDGARLGLLYAAALAAQRLRDWTAADGLLDRADALAAGAAMQAQPSVARVLAMARVQGAIDRSGAGRGAVLQTPAVTAAAALIERDASRPALLLRAHLALARARAGLPAADELNRAMQALQTWVIEHRRDAPAWDALALAAAARQLPLRARRAEAEAVYARGDVLGAVDRLRGAQLAAAPPGGRDDTDLAIIQARLREWEPARQRAAAEARGERVPD